MMCWCHPMMLIFHYSPLVSIFSPSEVLGLLQLASLRCCWKIVRSKMWDKAVRTSFGATLQLFLQWFNTGLYMILQWYLSSMVVGFLLEVFQDFWCSNQLPGNSFFKDRFKELLSSWHWTAGHGRPNAQCWSTVEGWWKVGGKYVSKQANQAKRQQTSEMDQKYKKYQEIWDQFLSLFERNALWIMTSGLYVLIILTALYTRVCFAFWVSTSFNREALAA